MISFQITFQADELVFGDYDKNGFISKIMFRKFLGQFKAKTRFFLYKGPVKLIQQVKIAHSFLQLESNQFHFISLSLPI